MEHITKEETELVQKLYNAWKEYINTADKEHEERQNELNKKYGMPENGWRERPPMSYYEESSAITNDMYAKYPHADLDMDAENYPALWSFLNYCGVLIGKQY